MTAARRSRAGSVICSAQPWKPQASRSMNTNGGISITKTGESTRFSTSASIKFTPIPKGELVAISFLPHLPRTSDLFLIRYHRPESLGGRKGHRCGTRLFILPLPHYNRHMNQQNEGL